MVSQRCRRNVFLEALLSTGRPSLLGAMSNSSGGASNASNALNATLGQMFCVGNQTVNCTMANATAPPAAPPEDIDGDGVRLRRAEKGGAHAGCQESRSC